MSHTAERERHEVVANATFKVNFTTLDNYPNVYSAMVEINGKRFGYIQQRAGGLYEAYNWRNRLIAYADSLSALRLKIVDYYATELSTAT